MKVSVVIVSYKVPYHLMLCLESLQKAITDLEAEIIVVDNASNDQTSELIPKHFPNVKFIQNPSNDGFSKANNIGINQAQGEYICLVNPDTILTETCITSAIEKHQSLKNCGILGLRLIDGTGHFLPESKINKLTLKVAALKMLGFSKQFYNNNLSENDEGQTATLVGAFMCFKKQDYNQLDGLDERYFMYGEDIDLSYQFTKAGFQNYYLGSEKIIHFKGESTLRDEVYFKRFFDSVKLFFTKHYTNSKLMIGVVSVFFFIAKYLKKNKMSKQERTEIDFNSVYVFSDNMLLIENLKSVFNQEVKLLNFVESNRVTFKKDLIIFDPSGLSFQEIVNFIVEHRSENNLFRFIIPQSNVLLGSDSSTSQAKVMPL
ncbi:glycosyltransferase family 2 protein [Flavobacteriaceae bacterium 14752]|uniref:glycosyltransferase family 2 protein n=1 Tax=Mesohalobacter salilacus TaxID=2491711 RepID=UPI000F63D14A|nr:glycosyltransferase family 2 protein [Flavobacteriaceae bacterium 14752]